MLTLKNFAIFLLLILATGLSAWSILISPQTKPNLKANPKEADSFMQDVIAIIFNETGKPSLKLITPKMVHYPDNNTTDVNTPRVTVFRNSTKPWYIESNYAKASQGIHKIVFWSQVTIHHPTDEANPNTTLKTESLTIFPNQEIATTHEPVTFIQPDTTVHAVGMLANLNKGTVKLFSKAQGEYAPNS